MAMFGNRPPLQIDQTGAPMQIVAGDQPLPQITPPITRGGGFLGKAAPFLGVIGDALLAANGRPAMYTPLVARQRERQAEMQDAMTRWQQQFDYERAHPKPVNNDTANDYAFITEHLGKGAADQYLRNIGDPMISIPLPGNRIYSGPRSGLGNAMGNVTAPAGDIPTVGDQASYDAVPAGGQYRDPSGHIRTKGGGAGNGVGGFRNIPSGNPLQP